MDKNLERLIKSWKSSEDFASNVVVWQKFPERLGDYVDLPDEMPEALQSTLRDLGIHSLYTHQAEAVFHASSGENLVITTGTASGKSLCYQIPVLEALCRDPQARALFIFPTKALTHDQQESMQGLLQVLGKHQPDLSNLVTSVYDGDTPTAQRQLIRSQTRILMTNPDMLHTAILPHHTLWADFISHLRFVILDEIHVYRGVFGSHIANLMRRLRRVAKFYNAWPQHILTSATISNAQEHASRFIEGPVSLISQDASPHGEQNVLLYNPPLVDTDLGIRRGALAEGLQLAEQLLEDNIQSIIFARSRRSVELMLRQLQQTHKNGFNDIRGYRSGYLRSERREIEVGLRQGNIKMVVATNALELGVDIGGMGAVILIGYPGTIAATRQQMGRAGRRQSTSIAIMVASANPLDQYLTRHPEFLLERNPEQALINPENSLILLQHLRCAAFELPFRDGDGFGNLTSGVIAEFLEYLRMSGVLTLSGKQYYWIADKYPAAQVSLRSAGGEKISLRTEVDGRHIPIGEIDRPSAFWMTHPGAIYLHDGVSYRVENLDLEENKADLIPVNTDYYTEALQQSEVEKITEIESQLAPAGQKCYGEIQVTTQITGYRKVQWLTRSILGSEELSLPSVDLRTIAYWFVFSAETVDILRSLNLWSNDANQYGPNWKLQRNLARQRDRNTCQICGVPEQDKAHHVHHKIPFRQFPSYEQANRLDNLITLCPVCHQRAEMNLRVKSGLSGLGYVLHNLAPMLLMCDQFDLGVHSDPQSPLGDGQPTIVLYDLVPAGIGLSDALYLQHRGLVKQAYDLVKHCPCGDGCPSCVGPGGENGGGGKREALALLAVLNGLDISNG